MRKLILLVIVAAAVLYFAPGLRQKIWYSIRGTAAEWTKPDAGPAKGVNIVKVYVLRGGKYYHRKDCPEIAGQMAVPTPLQEARELYQPCPVCDPPR
jgi:hypothetical protein